MILNITYTCIIYWRTDTNITFIHTHMIAWDIAFSIFQRSNQIPYKASDFVITPVVPKTVQHL